MEDEIFIAFYVAIPVVILVAGFVYYMNRRKEDLERVPGAEEPDTPG